MHGVSPEIKHFIDVASVLESIKNLGSECMYRICSLKMFPDRTVVAVSKPMLCMMAISL